MKRTPKGVWIVGLFALVTLLHYLLFSSSAEVAESYYGHVIYPGVRWLLHVLPWPAQGLIWTLGTMMGVLIWLIIRSMRSTRGRMLKRLSTIVVYLFMVAEAFYWLWGFNYMRPELPDRLGVQLEHPDTTWLFDQLEVSIARMNGLVHQVDQKSDDWEATELAKLDAYITSTLGYHDMRQPTLTRLRPEGGLLRWSTAGIYWPYTGQPHVDAGLHPLTWPATQLHEWAHAYGVTSEADCNYLAYEIGRRSADAYVAYSAERLWHRHLARACLTADAKRAEAMLETRDPQIYAYGKAIRAQHDKYGRWMPQTRDVVYDAFLKANRVEGGIKSYSYIVRLKYAVDKAGR